MGWSFIVFVEKGIEGFLIGLFDSLSFLQPSSMGSCLKSFRLWILAKRGQVSLNHYLSMLVWAKRGVHLKVYPNIARSVQLKLLSWIFIRHASHNLSHFLPFSCLVQPTRGVPTKTVTRSVFRGCPGKVLRVLLIQLLCIQLLYSDFVHSFLCI